MISIGEKTPSLAWPLEYEVTEIRPLDDEGRAAYVTINFRPFEPLTMDLPEPTRAVFFVREGAPGQGGLAFFDIRSAARYIDAQLESHLWLDRLQAGDDYPDTEPSRHYPADLERALVRAREEAKRRR